MVNPIRANELEIRNVDGKVLVHDPAHDKVHVLNSTAGEVLKMCDGTLSSNEIAHSISNSTGADISVVIGDVASILRDFANLQLVIITSCGGTPADATAPTCP